MLHVLKCPPDYICEDALGLLHWLLDIMSVPDQGHATSCECW